MAFKKCPGCDGKGKYVGFRKVEDPCETCEGDGLVEITEEDPEFDEWEDLPDTEEINIFGVSEEDRDDFYPFAQFIDDAAKFVKRVSTSHRRAIPSIRTKQRQLYLRTFPNLAKKLSGIDLDVYFVVDLSTNPGNLQGIRTYKIRWDDWGRAAQISPSELRKIMETQKGRERLLEFITHRNFKLIDTGFLPGMRLIDAYLKARGL